VGRTDAQHRARTLAQEYPEITFVCPLHPNPAVRSVFAELDPIENLQVVEPMPHDDFVALLAGSLAILTDSGGMQEEATVLGVPVVILRDETERPEVLEVGVGTLVGTSQERIFEVARSVIADRLANRLQLPSESPFGDGSAGVRSARAIEAFLRGRPLPPDMAPV
jgi:UDP-N-acetylglucosamine 2-epimerase (non-hydrolysing)